MGCMPLLLFSVRAPQNGVSGGKGSLKDTVHHFAGSPRFDELHYRLVAQVINSQARHRILLRIFGAKAF